MHVAVLALLKTVHVALVAEVATHRPDDGKLESRVGSHRIAENRSVDRETGKCKKVRMCLLTRLGVLRSSTKTLLTYKDSQKNKKGDDLVFISFSNN